MISETNVVTGVRTEREYNAKELTDIEASKPTPAQTAEAESQAAKAALTALDVRSIRSIREYIVSKADAPAHLKALETQALALQAKVLP